METTFTDPATSKNYTLDIQSDDNPENPFTEWDCEPPLMFQVWDTVTHCWTDSIISILIDLTTHRDLAIHRKEILEVSNTDTLNDTNIPLVEILARIAKIPYLRYESKGYSQGDSADVLIILTPEYIEKIWAKKDSYESHLLDAKKLFNAWIWWDVYGYTLTENIPLYTIDWILSKNTDTELVDSCWWFYGDDHTTNGLKDNLPDFARPHLENLK